MNSETRERLRAAVWKRDGGRCQACGCACVRPRGGRLREHAGTLDHVVPRSRGGSNRLSNLQLLCFACNQLKGDSMVDPDRQHRSIDHDADIAATIREHDFR